MYCFPPPDSVGGDSRKAYNWCASGGRAVEAAMKFGETIPESSVPKEKLSILDAHEAVESVLPAGLIMAEPCRGQFGPLSVSRFYPLIAV